MSTLTVRVTPEALGHPALGSLAVTTPFPAQLWPIESALTDGPINLIDLKYYQSHLGFLACTPETGHQVKHRLKI